MKSLLSSGLMCLAATSGATATVPADSAEIGALEAQQVAAWNAPDIDAYSALFTDNADVVNVLGWHWRSRIELKQKLGSAFGSVFAHSAMQIAEVTVDVIKPGVAVAIVRLTMTGALSPIGSGTNIPIPVIQTQSDGQDR